MGREVSFLGEVIFFISSSEWVRVRFRLRVGLVIPAPVTLSFNPNC